MSVVRFGMRVPATGKQGVMDIHHWFRFDDAGKVSQYRGTEDTALTAELLRKARASSASARRRASG